MAPNNGGTSGVAPAMTPESWAQMTACVNQLAAESQQLREELDLARSANTTRPKANRPSAFTGKPGTVDAWVAHMDTYVAGASDTAALAIVKTYLEGEAFSWLRSHEADHEVRDWPALREALQRRFNPLNKVQAARDLLHKWKQVKDVATFNKSFQTIVMSIPDITTAEKIDRYSRGLKSYIWESLCTKGYTDLESLMVDALKVEAAKRGGARITGNGGSHANGPSSRSEAVPMDISAINVPKLTPEERKRCMREGLCLRCRAKGHMARNCPKGRRN